MDKIKKKLFHVFISCHTDCDGTAFLFTFLIARLILQQYCQTIPTKFQQVHILIVER